MSSAYNWPHEGCEGLWHFENDATDSSGGGHDGTDVGGVTFAFGRFGKCAVFDGTARFELSTGAYVAEFKLTTFTILMWYKSTDTSSRSVLFMQEGVTIGSYTTRYYGYEIETASGVVRLIIGDGSTSWALILAGVTLVNDGEWHHIAATRDADYARIYVDGKMDAEEPNPVAPVFSGTYRTGSIGGGYTEISFSYYPICQMDELQLLDYALTSAQMSRLYAFQRGML